MTVPASPAGVFNPSQDVTFTGNVDFEQIPSSGQTSAIITTTAVQTLTNKILTTPTLTSPVLNAPTTTTNIGILSFTGATVIEYGDGVFHQSYITFDSFPLTLLDASQGVGQLLYSFPGFGAITILGASGSLAEKTTSILANTLNASAIYNWGVGSVTQSHGTLATTEQDIIQATNGTASATINVSGATSYTNRTGAPVQFAPALSAYFNVGIATATDIDADATTLWSGRIVLTWLYNGNIP